MPKLLSFALIVIIVAVGLYLGFGSKYFQKPQPKKYTGPVEKIVLGMQKTGLDFKPLILVAQDRQFFAENGLEVVIQDEVSSVTVNQSLKMGKIDIGTVGNHA